MKQLLVILLLFPPAMAQQSAAPDWKLKDVTGRSIRLRDYKGKVVLLNFWATWCSPCRAEIPELIKWQRRYAGAGLQIIGITYPPQTRSEIQQFARKYRINYPIIQGTNELKSYFTSSETLPWTVVLDAAGNVHDHIEGILYEDELAEKIVPLLPPNQKRKKVSCRNCNPPGNYRILASLADSLRSLTDRFNGRRDEITDRIYPDFADIWRKLGANHQTKTTAATTDKRPRGNTQN